MPNMLWSRYHGHASSESDFNRRRHSSVDCTQLERRNEHFPAIHQPNSQPITQSFAEESDLKQISLEQLNVDENFSNSTRPPSPAAPEPLPRPQRFSLFRSRHASDSQLSKTAKSQASTASPPMPPAPAIITTAPTMEQLEVAQKRKSTFSLPRRRKAPDPLKMLESMPSSMLDETLPNVGQGSASSTPGNQSARISRITFDEPERQRGPGLPPAYGDDTNTSLALPISRLSESSRSDGSYGENGVYATTTTTHTVSTTTTFFRMPRRKKNNEPLFPLPDKVPSQERPSFASYGTRDGRSSESPSRHSPVRTSPVTAILRPFHGRNEDLMTSQFPSPSHSALAASSTIFAAPWLPAQRTDYTPSARSGRSSPAPTPPTLGRSSTRGSLRKGIPDEPLATPPLPQPSRTSTSTSGRASLGGLFGLSRLRHNSEPQYPRHGSGSVPAPDTPASNGSKSHSLNLVREPVVVPRREEGDTPAKYLARLEEAVSRSVVATIISKSGDEFSKNVLRSYMRGFSFFGYPLDMSIRKLLMEVELPKETQQIDRVLQAFANRYHECNPGVYASPDEAHFIAFSILILHTDVFNKNNKHKMQKSDYCKNAKEGHGVAEEILECFYDNISYTPFIHVEDDVDINGERIIAQRPRRNLFAKPSTDSIGTLKKPSREPVDPYTLILDNKLDTLRPSLKDVMNLDDPYNYLGTSSSLNLADLHKTFFKSGILQILSSRSRPQAFKSPEGMANPAEAHPGVVDIKVTKVGMLSRKDVKKKKARPAWQEWGAILTGSQLYFFRNTTWIRSLIHQYEQHHKLGLGATPVTFRPPLDHFKPDFLTSTEEAVALMDTSYKKHKNGFVFVRHGGFEETFLAENEVERNDWLAKLNYASAFRTAGVRIRGLIGGNYEGQRTRGVRRMESGNSEQSVQTSTGEVLIRSGRIDAELAREIQTARRQIMAQKISEAEKKLDAANKQLEVHLRNARHLQILAPVQSKTRERVILAAGGMAAKIKWLRMDMWRTRCHKDILALDLEEEARSNTDRNARNDGVSATTLESQPAFFGSPESPPRRGSVPRPSTQPSPTRTFKMEDVFQPSFQLLSTESQHKPHNSWELPPLSFEVSSSSLPSGSSRKGSAPSTQGLTHRSSLDSIRAADKHSDLISLATRLVTPAPSVYDDEHKLLQEAGVVDPESSSPNTKRVEATSDTEKESDVEKSKIPELDFGESKSKARRSLHRTLRDAHVPAHHRSKKGKDSASSVTMTEDTLSVTESEGLARGAGSFTVHGKKASVITFGSEWQDMSPEERLKSRKSVQGDEVKAPTTRSTVGDEGASTTSARPTSATTISTTGTTKNGADFET